MSAIAGLWCRDGQPDAAEGCARMLAAQEIYAHDGRAQWADGPVALGRGLSKLLPEDAFDRQPLIGGGGKFVLVADLRLDNRDELTAALNISVERARTLCDAAVLLAAFERWDNDCYDHLVGDYAFALWDANGRRLVLARSPMGQRPLHYHLGKGFFAFASMPKGLHALPEIPYAPDEERFAEFIAMLPDAGTRSFFAGIERVPPAHFALVTTQGISLHRHWQPHRRTFLLRSADEYVEAMRHHLDEAVRCRLRGTDNVGATLSAGLDSSAVATTAARLLQPSGRKVIAFTAVPREGYDGRTPARRLGDEGPLAAMTAAMHPNIEHVLVRSDRRSPFDDLDRSFFFADQPSFLLMSWGMAYSINDAAREAHVKVMLAGGLGNAAFSYDGLALLPELVRSGRWLSLWHEMSALVTTGQMSWRGVIGHTLGPWMPAWLWRSLNRFGRGNTVDILTYTALSRARRAELGIDARARARRLDLAYRPAVDSFAARLQMIGRNDPGNLFKALLGGWRIDLRNPLIDRRLIEFCFAVPTEQFLSRGEFRSLTRRVLADRVPQAVLNERRRGFQAADWHERVTAARDRLAASIEQLAACAPAARALDIARMQELIRHWPAYGWEQPELITAYRQVLLGSISGGIFCAGRPAPIVDCREEVP